MTTSLDWVDSLPPEVRALVHEFGERAVRACWDLRITEARQIRTLIVSCRSERGQATRVPLSAPEMACLISQNVNLAGDQKTFAKRAGISPGLLSMVLNGKRPANATVANAVGYVARTVFEPVRL